MLATLTPFSPTPVVGHLLQWYLTFNSGAAFSLGSRFTPLFPILGILIFCGLVLAVVPRVRLGWWATATGLLLGGILGNLYDRLFRAPGPLRGEVVDFIMLPHFAIFNVADMFICTAAGLYIVLVLWGHYSFDGTPTDAKDKR